MADQKHRAVVVRRAVSCKQIQRLDVEIVGRLVEHQQVRLPRHEPREEQPRLLAARQRADGRAGLRLVEQEVLEIAHHVPGLAAHHHLVGAGPTPASPDRRQAVPERRLGVERRARLVEDRHLDAGAKRHRPCVGRDPRRSASSAAWSCPRRSGRRRPPGRPARSAGRSPRQMTRSPKAFEMPLRLDHPLARLAAPASSDSAAVPWRRIWSRRSCRSPAARAPGPGCACAGR